MRILTALILSPLAICLRLRNSRFATALDVMAPRRELLSGWDKTWVPRKAWWDLSSGRMRRCDERECALKRQNYTIRLRAEGHDYG